MEMLLEQDPDLSKRDKDGCTALHRGVEGGHREITECLLKANASSLDQDNNGKIPLHLASIQGDFCIVERLMMNSRACLTIEDDDGKIAADYCPSGSKIHRLLFSAIAHSSEIGADLINLSRHTFDLLSACSPGFDTATEPTHSTSEIVKVTQIILKAIAESNNAFATFLDYVSKELQSHPWLTYLFERLPLVLCDLEKAMTD